ncbi:MAG: Uma2 family endonuclease [Spirochaetaceae bacterium]|nr:MAG: Uma2 family endonuclease [Spirochaetaceae bacterium]
MEQVQEQRRYSWREYLSWPEWERYELIDGVAYAMSPAPRRRHQEIAGELFHQIYAQMRERDCSVFPAPFDVKLSDDRHDQTPTVVQPDITVSCDPTKLTEQGMTGAPDLVVEIVSPESGLIDRGRKFELYRRYGVREYWIVDQDERLVEVYLLESSEASNTRAGATARAGAGTGTGKSAEDQGVFRRDAVYGPADTLRASAVSELSIDLSEVFPPISQ